MKPIPLHSRLSRMKPVLMHMGVAHARAHSLQRAVCIAQGHIQPYRDRRFKYPSIRSHDNLLTRCTSTQIEFNFPQS